MFQKEFTTTESTEITEEEREDVLRTQSLEQQLMFIEF